MVSASQQYDYKTSKESFVSGTTGSTVSHINMVSFVALVCFSFAPYILYILTTPPLQGLSRPTLGHPLAFPPAQIVPLPL